MPILAARRLYQRAYRLMRAHDPTSIIAIHMSGYPLMALQSYADIICDGENWSTYLQVMRDQKGWDNYTHSLPLDVVRAQYRNHWGPDTAFMPMLACALGAKYNEETPHALASAEHVIGLFFVHDSGLWPCYTTMEPYGRLFSAQDRFGWDEQVSFVPYWNLQGLAAISTTAELSQARPAEEHVRPENPPLVISLFRRPGRVMLVPFNNTDQDVPVTLTWDAAKLGLGPVSEIEDYFHGTKAAAQGSSATLTVPKRSFGMWVAQ